MTGPMRVVVVGEACPPGSSGEQLTLLLKGLHLRADVQVAAAWERGDTPGWRRYASRRLVVDDLRTWGPSKWLTPASRFAAGKLRGAELRRRLMPIIRPDVMLRVDGTGTELAARIGPARVNGVIVTGERTIDQTQSGIAVVLSGAPVPARSTLGVFPVPQLIDGAWARAAGSRSARAELRTQLGIGPGPVVVGIGAGIESATWFTQTLAAADDTDAPTTGIWLTDDEPECEFDGTNIMVAAPSRELTAMGDVVVVVDPTPRSNALAVDALVSGARTYALAGAVAPNVAQLVDLAPDHRCLATLVGSDANNESDRDRDTRIEQARQTIDVVPVAARLAAVLRNTEETDGAA